MSYWLVVVHFCVLMFGCASLHADVRIVYPSPESSQDQRSSDIIELLEETLSITEDQFGKFDLIASSNAMSEARAFFELEKSREIDVVWAPSSISKEREFLPIRIPLRKGLSMIHLPLVIASNEKMLADVHEQEALNQYTFGILHRDDKILFSARRITTTIAASYEGLFRLLSFNRVSIVLRPATDIFHEMVEFHFDYPGIVIDSHLAIKIPRPIYFFVSKENTLLASRITEGLQKLRTNGVFDRIFQKYHGQSLEELDLPKRRLLNLGDPELLPELPKGPGLWIDSLPIP